MQVPANTPLLVWCLVNGMVKSDEYLAWACDHYGMAVLNAEFFEHFDRESLTSLRAETSWSAWCFPVGKWDDVIFVACSEPLPEMPDGNYTFVLADPRLMGEAWGTNAVAEEKVIEAPIGINLNATRTFVLNLDELSGSQEHAEKIDPNEIDENDKTQVTLSVVLNPAPKTDSANNAPAVATQTTASQTNASRASAPPPAPSVKQTTRKNQTGSKVTDDGEIAVAFDRLHENYQSALLMQCADGFAKPYKWDESLPIVRAQEKFNVNLGFPSFFRIVAKTLQPYHGYVIDSPAHKEFFENLNFEAPPACVTAVPVKAGEKLWGILVCFGGEASKTTEALEQAVAICEKLSASHGEDWSKAA